MTGKKLEPWVSNDTDIAKYVFESPRFTVLANHEGTIKNQLFPDRIFMDKTMTDKVKGPCWVHHTIRYAIPDPEPIEWAHTHDHDEMIALIGLNPWRPDELGAVIDFYIDDKPYRCTKTCYLYIPAGVRHCPHIHIEINYPYMLQAIVFNDNLQYPEQPIPTNVNYVEGFPFLLADKFLTKNPDVDACLAKYPDK